MTDPSQPGWAQPNQPPPPGPPPPPTPWPASGTPAPPGVPAYPPFGQPGAYAPPPGAPVRRGTNGLAVAGFVLGLLWVCGIGSLLAIVFGFIAIGQIKRLGGGGRGLAIAAIVIGSLGLLITVGGAIAVALTADDVIDQIESETDDVEIASCAVGDDGRAVVRLEITNSSSRRSNYFITLNVTEGNVTETIGTDVGPVRPDETAEHVVRTERGNDFSNPDCDILFADRSPAG